MSVVSIASRSKAAARHGIRTRSAARAARDTTWSALGAVSSTRKPAPFWRAALTRAGKRAACPLITSGASAARRSAQLAAVACGSRSMMAVVCPARAAAVARCTARVVFPAPPFWLMMATIFMRPRRIGIGAEILCRHPHMSKCLYHHMRPCGHKRRLSSPIRAYFHLTNRVLSDDGGCMFPIRWLKWNDWLSSRPRSGRAGHWWGALRKSWQQRLASA